VLENILSSQPSGRLYKALVTSKKANSVSASAYPCHDPGVLEILAEVDQKGSLDAARDTITDVLEVSQAGDHEGRGGTREDEDATRREMPNE